MLQWLISNWINLYAIISSIFRNINMCYLLNTCKCILINLKLFWFFLYLFEPTKTHNDISQRSVQFSARKLRSETISYIFGWCLYQNQRSLKLKSDSCIAFHTWLHLLSMTQNIDALVVVVEFTQHYIRFH